MSFVCLLDILPRPGAAELRVALILVCRRVASALKHPASADPVHDERGVRTYEVLAAAARTHAWQPQRGHLPSQVRQRMCAPSAQHQHRAEFRRDRRPTAQPALFACGQRLPRRCGCLADIPGWLHSSGTSSTVPSEGLEFDPIAPVPEKVDAITVPYGYRWTPILRWGDPLFADSPD